MSKRLVTHNAVAALLLAMLGLTSCEHLVCTLIGCSDGIQITFTGNVPIGGRVLASADGQPPRIFNCLTAQPCSFAFFNDFTPARVSITVESAAGNTTRTFTPTYRKEQPNGEGCSPTCLIAQIEMQIP